MNGILNRVRTWFGGNGQASMNGDTPRGITAATTGTENVAVGTSALKSRPTPALQQEREDCQAAACCRHCGAELEVVCPNGHGGADEVLADLAAPKKRAPAPSSEETVTLKCSVTGCDAQPVAWKGRGRKPTRCEKHLTKQRSA